MAATSIISMNHSNDKDLGGQDDKYPVLDKMNRLRSLIGDDGYLAWMRGKFPHFMEMPMSEIEAALDAKVAECEQEVNDAAWLAFADENRINTESISVVERDDQPPIENQRIDALLDELNECNVFTRALEIEEALANLGITVAREIRDKMIGEYMDSASDARRDMKNGVGL